MLGKLIKYDLRYMIRRFGPLWLGLAAVSMLNGFTIRQLDSGRLEGTMLFIVGIMPLIVLFALWVAVAVLTLTYICERFYKGLLGDEGYLMFTLPVTTGEHIASKTVTALILQIATGIVGLLSWGLLMVVYRPAWVSFFFEVLPELWAGVRQVPLWFWLELLVLALVTAVSQTLHIYAAISLGHMAKKHRAGWAFAAYIGISMAQSILLSALVPLLANMPDEWFFYMDGYGVHGMQWVAAAALGATILWQLVKCAAFFFGSDYILKNKLNLE